MSLIHVMFELDDQIVNGLATGDLERIGGVIREVDTKRIVAWLRQVGPSTNLSQLLRFTSVASALDLAVSTMSFAVMMKRLNAIETQLQLAQEVLQAVDYKVDLSFYANFRAAIELAKNAFTMSRYENRKVSASQAINRFLEAEQHYKHLVDLELKQASQVADEYLLTLALAHVAEVRCYLQLEELATAHRRFQEGAAQLRPRFERLVRTLLTSNPAVYLHPELKDQIDLSRLTRVYQWLEPGWDENSVFQAQRENFFKAAQELDTCGNVLPGEYRIDEKGRLARLRDAIPSRLPSFARDRTAETKPDDITPFDRLAVMFDLIEQAVESDCRYQTYGTEIEAALQLDMSFKEWEQLTAPLTEDDTNPSFVFIKPSEPLQLSA